MKTYLNLGCGARYHPAWTNIDIAPRAPGVIQHDLSKGIPLPDAGCDVVYHAAVFEHIRRADALPFLLECGRVLKPNGIIRVGVPDLEKLCLLYSEKLQAALEGSSEAANDYDWIMLELFDQTVRERSGGDMAAYLKLNPLPNEEFVFDRIGEEGRQLVQTFRQSGKTMPSSQMQAAKARIRRLLARILVLPNHLRAYMLSLLLGAGDRHALEIGRFRLSGEVHQWMYDRFSLARLLQNAGFVDPVPVDAKTSRIPDWTSFHLDTLPDGTVIKPDLFFMEATKK